MGRDGTGVRAASATSIEIAFTYRRVRCRERIALKPTPANLKAAERHRAAILDAIARDTFDYATTFPDSPRAIQFAREPGAAISLAVWLDRWMRNVSPGLKASTRATHRRIVNRLIEGLGAHTLTALRWRDIRAWIDLQEVGNKTGNNLLSVLRSALQAAVDDDIIETNPIAGHRLRHTPGPHPGDEIDPFSADERAAILSAAAGQERHMIQFALWTGLRISELCALDWADVDWIGGQIRVARALTQAARGTPEDPKTAAGRRAVKLLGPARAALQAQRAHTELMGGPIFTNPRTGKRWPGDLTFRVGAWTRILRRAGVRYRYPYQLRHTYASMMLMAGERPQWLATQMGHRDWTFTARTYARWIATDAPDAGGLAEAAWSGETSVHGHERSV